MEFKQIAIPTLEVDLPKDQSQVPDLFIYLYTESGYFSSYDEKIGFYRISAKDLFKTSKQD